MSRRTSHRGTFRRTRRTALAVGGVTLATFLATTPGAASPSQEAPFNNGTGSATAIGYKVNPTSGNLSFGITAGESIAGHQNTGGTGQSRAVNLGVIGVTLGAEPCDGGDPTLPLESQPQALVVRTGEEGAEGGITESEAGAIEKFARATAEPYGEAITTIAPLGEQGAVYIDGGRTITHSGVVDGNVREAYARTELGTVNIAGLVEIRGLRWEAIHRTGAVEETLGSFHMGDLVIGGQVIPLPGDGLEQLDSLKDVLAPLGLDVSRPRVRVEQGIVFVDPLKIGIVPNDARDGLLQPIFSAIQPIREALTDALLELDCSTSTFITVADLVLGSISGAGGVSLELGGVQATTAEIDAYEFAPIPALPELPSIGSPSASGSGGLPSSRPSSFSPAGGASSPAAAPPASDSPASGDSGDLDTSPVSDVTGERGGWMALVGGGGLLTLLATAEGDRRKMRNAQRDIPLEA